MSFVIVLFPEPRDVFIDDQPQGTQLESFKDCEELAKEQRRLLLTSPEFLAAMRQLAPSWKPEPAPIDPALVREACPPS